MAGETWYLNFHMNLQRFPSRKYKQTQVTVNNVSSKVKSKENKNFNRQDIYCNTVITFNGSIPEIIYNLSAIDRGENFCF